MSEVVILEEMAEAGAQMLAECRKRKMDEVTTCVQVYLAMEAVKEVMRMKTDKVH